MILICHHHIGALSQTLALKEPGVNYVNLFLNHGNCAQVPCHRSMQACGGRIKSLLRYTALKMCQPKWCVLQLVTTRLQYFALYEFWIRVFTWCPPKVVGQVGIVNCERSLWTLLFDKKGCLRPATFLDIFRHVLIATIPCHGTQACSTVDWIAVHFARASQVNHHEDQQWMAMTCLMRLMLIVLNVLSRIVQF